MTVRWRGGLAVMAACLAFGTVPADAAPAAPALAGTTTITGSRSAWAAVRLPRAVDLDVYADIDVQARGRITGIVLKKDGAWDAPMAEAIHHGFCATAGCAPTWPNEKIAFIWTPGSQNGLTGRLPAGNYRIYLLADGAPVRAVLRLRGLAGTRTITPRSTARAEVVQPAPTLAQPAAGPMLFAGGSSRAVGPSGGLHALVIWKDLPVLSPPSATGVCAYDGTPPAANAYQLPCSGGSGGVPPYTSGNNTAGPSTTPVGPGRFVSALSTGHLLPEGEFGIGAYHYNAGPVTAAYVQQLWLRY